MIKSGFDFVAPFYDSLAGLVFGRAIRDAQIIFLNMIPRQSRILIIGGGTGWILPELFTHSSPARIVYLEASPKMLNLARQQIINPVQEACTEFRLGSEKNIRPEEKFDAVISHFFLDLFLPDQLTDITNIIFKSLRPGGFWLIADFIRTPGRSIRPICNRILIKSMYAFFRVLSRISAAALPNWEEKLTEFAMEPQKSAFFYHRLIKSVIYQKT